MLVLTRKFGEQINIGDDIVLTVMEGPGGEIRIGIDAPRSVKITRSEVLAAIGAENRAAASASVVAEGSLVAALGALGGPVKPPGPAAGGAARQGS
ncbi:carbon storage regulator [Pseudarthrobacter sp. BIM B-2242]|uniref:carbon storage regulator n=1 Tax=Pseudarthrobacter sp. BIM B-2242 TaxID=2772401 RepID=UPI00168A662C|nr:carbon storage regulator [Pseudarthrobacter sp. BIM B-2242]QOD05741.1 carbon storage regulator [Pseudarthrobacter sp. BIM B-2242]